MKVRYTLLTAALLFALGVNLLALVLRTNAQTKPNRAGLVIVNPNGQVTTHCVTFDEPEITGYELLRRSNLPLVVDVSGGGTVCKIQNTGCSFPAQKCFCECQDMAQSCVYWQFYFQSANAWKYSPIGAFGLKVTNGSINGWSYAAGGASSGGLEPPLLTIDQICGTAAPIPTIGTAISATSAPVTSTTAPTELPQITKTPALSMPTTVHTDTPTVAATTVKSSTVVPSLPHATPSAEMSTSLAASVPTPTSTVLQAAATTMPTAPTSKSPTVATVASDVPPADSPSASSYVVFGVIAIILVGLLVLTRTGIGKSKP